MAWERFGERLDLLVPTIRPDCVDGVNKERSRLAFGQSAIEEQVLNGDLIWIRTASDTSVSKKPEIST